MDHLSALNWIDYLIVPAPGADERWHVHGGNDQVIHRAAATFPADSIHTGTPLRAIRRRAGGSYALDFDGVRRTVIADLVILTSAIHDAARGGHAGTPSSVLTNSPRFTSWRWGQTPR